MTTVANADRSHESIVNDTLARVLRERCGLPAAAETLYGGKRPDIIVRPSQGPVVLETELEEVSHLRVVDPACGTGTLLMAAYRQVIQNFMAKAPDSQGTSLFKQALVE